ncbi:MAG: hypothetical protein KC431_27545 [Myxococcales bacterium]|nr:hypothetical protein [Myxococcales bacterium]MCA9701308.1 hypothetical protein [Myxococcales bacterium]
MTRACAWVGSFALGVCIAGACTMGACLEEPACEIRYSTFYMADPISEETVAAVSDVCPELEATYQCCTAICTHEFELHTKHEIAVIDLCELVLGIDGPSDDVIHCEGSGQYEQCKE